MKVPVAAILSVCLSACQGSTEDAACHLNTVNGVSNAVPAGYVPPLVSNGSLCMLIDYLGGQMQQDYVKMVPTIFWAGRRYGPPKDQLIPFGHFETDVFVEGKKCGLPVTWTQTLDTKAALVTCSNRYDNGLVVETSVFTPLGRDMVVVRKRLSSANAAIRSARLTFHYRFTPTGGENHAPRRVVGTGAWNEAAKRAEFRFQADGHQPCDGLVSVFADKTVTAVIDKQVAALTTEIALDASKPVDVTFYLLFADSLDGNNYAERAAKMTGQVRRDGYEGLVGEHRQAWSAYWDASYVRLPDAELERVYSTAQYHLRANATRWSFPVGVFNTHWSGRFFAWDEMFCYQALISSNQRDIARRAPEFRRAGLKIATDRAAHYGRPGLFGARYPWETMENGTEGSPPGYWMEHIFHMSNIALTAWHHYLYTDDAGYLEKIGYPVIKECARFFLANMIYEWPDGSMIIGKCTDLERLGPSRLNPFMTSCGAIYTLETAVAGAAALKLDAEEAASWRHAATKLRESLPHESGRYVPYKGCQEESVASLGGVFPYPLFDETSELQRNAVYHYVRHGRAFGNMYKVGTSVCAWYLGWMSAALAELGDTVEPVEMLKEAAGGAGHFGEMFEINEEKTRRIPWFSTASGNVVYALNKMLVQNRDGRVLIARGVPASWKDYAFKLACHGDMVVETEIKGGKLARLSLKPGDKGREQQREIVLPAGLLDGVTLDSATVKKVIAKDGRMWLDVRFNGDTDIVQCN